MSSGRCENVYFAASLYLSSCFLPEGHDGAHCAVGVSTQKNAMLITWQVIEPPEEDEC